MPLFGNRNTRAAKLTPGLVARIRERYADGESQGSLAREFQISVTHIGRIVRGESWHQVAPPVGDNRRIAAESERLMQVQREVDALRAQGLDGYGNPLPPDPLAGGAGGADETDGSAAERMAREAAAKSPAALERELGISPEVAEKAKLFTGR